MPEMIQTTHFCSSTRRALIGSFQGAAVIHVGQHALGHF